MNWFEARKWLVVAAVACSGCGNRVDDIGVLVNTLGVVKEAVRASPPEAPGRNLLPGTFNRMRMGDLLGDDRPESIVEADDRKSLQVRGEDGSVKRVSRDDYIADFTVLPAAGSDKDSLVIHTYPNSQGGSTLMVLALTDDRTLASWDEKPPASRGVHAGRWQGSQALFYMVGDDVVIRGERGEPLARLPLRGATAFSTIHTVTMGGDRTALVLSGNGYTPYHAVAILDRDGAVVFHEQAPEHAFSLKADGENAFKVETRSQVWRYSLPTQ